MARESRLSVVIATFNRAPLLPECVASLRGAGVDNLQIIVVDDGSSDNTREVVKSLGGDIHYIYQENRGLSAARNTGIAAATTPYIAYLDSDDFWLPDVASTLLDLLDRNPDIGAIFTEARVGNPKEGYRSWRESAGTSRFDGLPDEIREEKLRVLESDSLYRLTIDRNVVFTGAIIQRTELVKQAGMFDTRLRATGDWELWMRMIPLARFAYWPDPLAIYVRHDSNMTNDIDSMVKAFAHTLTTHSEKGGDWYRRHQLAFRRALAGHLFDFGYLAYQRGEYSEAHRRFAAGLKQIPADSRLLLYWMGTMLPTPAVRVLRRARALLS